MYLKSRTHVSMLPGILYVVRRTSPLKDGENPSSANYWGFRYAFGKAYVRISCFIVADIISYEFYLRNIHFPHTS